MPVDRREMAVAAVVEAILDCGWFNRVDRTGDENYEEPGQFPVAVVVDQGEVATDGELGQIDPDLSVSVVVIVRGDDKADVRPAISEARAYVRTAMAGLPEAATDLITEVAYVGMSAPDTSVQEPLSGAATLQFRVRYTESELDPYSA